MFLYVLSLESYFSAWLCGGWQLLEGLMGICLLLCRNGIFSRVSRFNSGHTPGKNLSAKRQVLQPIRLLGSRSSLELETYLFYLAYLPFMTNGMFVRCYETLAITVPLLLHYLFSINMTNCLKRSVQL